MVVDKISEKALESLLSITFGDKTLKYDVIAKDGLNYDGINDIEIRFGSEEKKIHSPFSTIATKIALQKDFEEKDTLLNVMNSIKQKGIFSMLKGAMKKNEELSKLSVAAEKCIADELVKSQRVLDSKEFENPSLVLLIKGIKNLENPERIKGLNVVSIQEVGAVQIGMAVNRMKTEIPNLFSFNSYDERKFKRALSEVIKSPFISQCCENAIKQDSKIQELTVAANKDAQYDAYINGGSIDYSSSFMHTNAFDKHIMIQDVKKEATNRSNRLRV